MYLGTFHSMERSCFPAKMCKPISDELTKRAFGCRGLESPTLADVFGNSGNSYGIATSLEYHCAQVLEAKFTSLTSMDLRGNREFTDAGKRLHPRPCFHCTSGLHADFGHMPAFQWPLRI